MPIVTYKNMKETKKLDDNCGSSSPGLFCNGFFTLATLSPAEARACVCRAASQKVLDLIRSLVVLRANLS